MTYVEPRPAGPIQILITVMLGTFVASMIDRVLLRRGWGSWLSRVAVAAAAIFVVSTIVALAFRAAGRRQRMPLLLPVVFSVVSGAIVAFLEFTS